MTDWGADDAVGGVPAQLKEHDGLEMPVSPIPRPTKPHAQRIDEAAAARAIRPGRAAGVILVGEREGSRVPVVEPSPEAEDHRQGKGLSGNEGRLTRSHPNGRVTPVLGGNCAGGVEESGQQGWRCAAKAGFGPGSHRHTVGEGAPWSANPVDRPFGTQRTDWVDCFPRCASRGDASKVGAAAEPPAWLEVPKDRLKGNRSAAVLDALAPFVRADSDDAPVTACDRSLRNRLDPLDSQGAIQRGLPIGSGDIESAHRYLIQERLKLPGAGWSPDPVETMLALRLNRANREWETDWRGVEKEAA